MISDPYKVLGVSPTATDEEITKSYRRLAKIYHPDLNQGNEDAAKKMSEINAAYEQIKSGNAYQSSSGGYSGQSSQGYGNSSSGEQGPYDFDPFGGFGSFWGFGSNGQGQQQRRENSEFDSVKSYMNAGYYKEALNALSYITDKTSEWYYLSAILNYNTGNKITALNHAKTAMQMEPDNPEYQLILNQIQNGSRIYQQQSQNFGMPVSNINTICFTICLARLCCLFCGQSY
ncbi:MAG: J domain-containing protein [Clostridiaceae bacterium]